MTPVEFLAEWMFRSSILIASGTLLLWLLRVKDSPIRVVSWTAMLCGSFLIPILAISALTLALPKMFLPTIRRPGSSFGLRKFRSRSPNQHPPGYCCLSQSVPYPRTVLTLRDRRLRLVIASTGPSIGRAQS